jgi:hypothetical protein
MWTQRDGMAGAVYSIRARDVLAGAGTRLIVAFSAPMATTMMQIGAAAGLRPLITGGPDLPPSGCPQEFQDHATINHHGGARAANALFCQVVFGRDAPADCRITSVLRWKSPRTCCLTVI